MKRFMPYPLTVLDPDMLGADEMPSLQTNRAGDRFVELAPVDPWEEPFTLEYYPGRGNYFPAAWCEREETQNVAPSPPEPVVAPAAPVKPPRIWPQHLSNIERLKLWWEELDNGTA